MFISNKFNQLKVVFGGVETSYSVFIFRLDLIQSKIVQNHLKINDDGGSVVDSDKNVVVFVSECI